MSKGSKGETRGDNTEKWREDVYYPSEGGGGTKSGSLVGPEE